MGYTLTLQPPSETGAETPKIVLEQRIRRTPLPLPRGAYTIIQIHGINAAYTQGQDQIAVSWTEGKLAVVVTGYSSDRETILRVAEGLRLQP